MEEEREVFDFEEWMGDENWNEEEAFEREQQELSECHCGAWKYSEIQHRFIAVADCCC